MKTQTKRIVFAIIAVCLVAVLGMLAILLWGDTADSDVAFTKEIRVTDGVASQEAYTTDVLVPKDGGYRLNIEWSASPGLVTGVRLLDAAGNVCYGLAGEGVDAESERLDLTAGTYRLSFVPLTNAEDYARFALSFMDAAQAEATNGGRLVSNYEGEISDIGSYAFAANGTWRIHCAYTLERIGSSNAFFAIAVLAGAAVGALISILLLVLTKKDRSLEAKYDERQQLARGKGYRAGFWTAFAYFLVWIFADIAEIPIPAQNTVIAFTGMILSAFVYIAVCIRTDAFFALNENRRAVCIIMLIGGLANIFIGIMNVRTGEAIVDGMLTFRVINLLCGVFLAGIAVAMLLHRLRGAKEEDAE